MIENKGGPQLTHSQLNAIMDALLKIPRRHKLIHPCQDRNKYSSILDWLTNALAALRNQQEKPDIETRDIADQQQQLILSSLGEMVEMTRKECQQKSVILEIIQEYFVGTLNAYWTLFCNANREATYQYERSSLSIEQQYLRQLTELQAENEEMKKDRDHRWRNMFMLIKDNRVHRKQNRKLLKTATMEMEKNRGLAEQIIKLEMENEKLKLKLSNLEGQARLEDYIAACADLAELEDKIRKYPKKSKKALKNELLKIEIGQSKNLQDKIQFIIKAIEETGEIVDEIYDENVAWSNLTYNISTQTDLKTEEKGTNTPSLKTSSVEVETHSKDHIALDFIDTVLVKVLPQKKKKETFRESKNVMFATTMNLGKLAQKRDNEMKSRHASRKDIRQCSICQSIKITIFQGRIAYISEYNSEIFNGQPTGTSYQIEKINQDRQLKTTVFNDTSSQTEHYYEDCSFPSFAIQTKTSFKPNHIPKSLIDFDQSNDVPKKCHQFLEISEQCSFCVDPDKKRYNSKAKLSFNSEKQCDSLRSSVMLRKINKASVGGERRESRSDFRFAIKKVTKNDDKDLIEREIEEQMSNEKNEGIISSQSTSQENIIEELQEETPRNPALICKDNASPFYSKTTKPTSEDISEIMTPQYLSSKPFAHNLDTINTLKNEKPQIKRNQSSFLPQNQFKMLQSNRLSKLPKHKRTTTELNQHELRENLAPIVGREQNSSKQPSKMMPLHRISQDASETGDDKVKNLNQKSKEKTTNLLPFKIDKDGEFELKGNDFSRGVQKIIKTMDLRYNQLMNNGYTFKTYLSSHFKVLYGKELYQNFLNFLIHSSSSLGEIDEIIVCLNKLCNPKLPEGYSIDIFKIFAITVHKFLSINESPLQTKARSDILRYMVSQYLNEDQGRVFEVKMLRESIVSFFGWFNCLEMEVRKGTIQSQLFSFLLDVLVESEDTFSLNLLQQFTFFLNEKTETFKLKIIAKYQLGQKVPIHRLCLFCFKNQWKNLLNIQTTLEKEYELKLGTFSEEKCLSNILKHYKVFEEFKYLESCFRYRLSLHKKYFCGINRYLLMLVELTILQFQLKTSVPLSLDLRYLNLTFEGLQKKRLHEQMKTKLQSLDRNHRNTTIS